MGEWIQLGAYVAALVWGAATMRTELRYVRKDLNDFKTAVEKASEVVAETLTDHGERISRIEGRLD
jgi:hypothetical protein